MHAGFTMMLDSPKIAQRKGWEYTPAAVRRKTSQCVWFAAFVRQTVLLIFGLQLDQISVFKHKPESIKYNFQQLKIELGLMFPTHVILKMPSRKKWDFEHWRLWTSATCCCEFEAEFTVVTLSMHVNQDNRLLHQHLITKHKLKMIKKPTEKSTRWPPLPPQPEELHIYWRSAKVKVKRAQIPKSSTWTRKIREEKQRVKDRVSQQELQPNPWNFQMRLGGQTWVSINNKNMQQHTQLKHVRVRANAITGVYHHESFQMLFSHLWILEHD